MLVRVEAKAVESYRAGTLRELNIVGRAPVPLEGAPETVNRAPFGEGWMIRLKPAAADDGAALLDAAAYEQLVG